MMALKEIAEKEFNEICNAPGNYFCNGCAFQEDTDNLVAFPFYESAFEEPSKYFKVEK